MYFCNMCCFYTKSKQELEDHLSSHNHALRKIDITPFGGGIVPSSTKSSMPPINPIRLCKEYLSHNTSSSDLHRSPTTPRKNSILANLLQGKNILERNQAERKRDISLSKEGLIFSVVSTSDNGSDSAALTAKGEESEILLKSNCRVDSSSINDSVQNFQFNNRFAQFSGSESCNSAKTIDEMNNCDKRPKNDINVSSITSNASRNLQSNERVSSLAFSGLYEDIANDAFLICDKESANVVSDVFPVDPTNAEDFQSNKTLAAFEALTTCKSATSMDATFQICDQDSIVVGDMFPIENIIIKDFQSASYCNYINPDSNKKSAKFVPNYDTITFDDEAEVLPNSVEINKILDEFLQKPQEFQNNEIIPGLERFPYVTNPLSVHSDRCSKGTEIMNLSKYCDSDTITNKNSPHSSGLKPCNAIENVSNNNGDTISSLKLCSNSPEFGESDSSLNTRLYTISDEVPEIMTEMTDILSVTRNLKKPIYKKEIISDEYSFPNAQSFHCTVCQFISTTKSVIESHIKMHQPREGAKFKCYICPYFASTKRSIQNHVRDHHSLAEHVGTTVCPTETQCEITQKTFLLNESQNVETKNCESSIPHDFKVVNSRRQKHSFCPECPFKTTRKKCFNKHRNFHTSNDFSLKCKFCSFGANSQTILNTHLKLHRTSNKDFNDSEMDDSLESKDADKAIYCQLCPWMGESLFELQLHSEEHASIGKYPCPYCRFQAASSRGFSLHLRNHGRRIKLDKNDSKTEKSRKNNTVISLELEKSAASKKRSAEESSGVLKKQMISLEKADDVQNSGTQYENLNLFNQNINKCDTIMKQNFEAIMNDSNGYSLESLRLMLVQLNHISPTEYLADRIDVVSSTEILKLQKTIALAVQEQIKEPIEAVNLSTFDEEISEEDTFKNNKLCYKDGKLFFTN